MYAEDDGPRRLRGVPFVERAECQLDGVLDAEVMFARPSGKCLEYIAIDVKRFEHDEAAALGQARVTHAYPIGLRAAQLRGRGP